MAAANRSWKLMHFASRLCEFSFLSTFISGAIDARLERPVGPHAVLRKRSDCIAHCDRSGTAVGVETVRSQPPTEQIYSRRARYRYFAPLLVLAAPGRGFTQLTTLAFELISCVAVFLPLVLSASAENAR